MKQILIADDHEVVRSGLRAIIETRADWVVGGEATDGRDAVALALKVKPDVAIVDYSMPVMNGLEVSRRIKLHHLHTEVLILTMHESEEILTEVLLAGVRGFLLNQMRGATLLRLLKRCLTIDLTSPVFCWRNCFMTICQTRRTNRRSCYLRENRALFN